MKINAVAHAHCLLYAVLIHFQSFFDISAIDDGTRKSLFVSGCMKSAKQNKMHTHYHNSNLIWRTVSRLVDEVIPSDHPRRVASRVIQWYGLIHET